MSDIMTPIPFGKLMNWILEENKKGAVFGIKRPFIADPDKTYEIFGRKLETPFGPAAGPHTQLTQNIVASYVAGVSSSLRPYRSWTARTFPYPNRVSRLTTSAITASGPQSSMCPRHLTSM